MLPSRMLEDLLPEHGFMCSCTAPLAVSSTLHATLTESCYVACCNPAMPNEQKTSEVPLGACQAQLDHCLQYYSSLTRYSLYLSIKVVQYTQ